LADQAVARLLDSEELWLLVEEIAQSPAVTDAITQQGFGFADQVAGGMRARSRNADAWRKRTAERLLELATTGTRCSSAESISPSTGEVRARRST
jgi:hypothetical protein